jgi:hypothetical protein
MRTIALRYFLIVSAALAGGSALLLCPPASASETPLSDLRALTSATDRSHDPESSPDGRWTMRLVADDNSTDSTDDDGDDAPDGIVAAAPGQIEVDGNASVVPSRPLQVVNRGNLDSCTLRGPPAGVASDSSQDSSSPTNDAAPRHAPDHESFELASGSQSLRAPPN